MVEADQAPARVEHHADRVEADRPCARPGRPFAAQPGHGCPPQARALAVAQGGQRVESRPGARPGSQRPCLDLSEHERAPVAGDQVDLAVAGANVAPEHCEAEALEVRRRKLLSDRPEGTPSVGPAARAPAADSARDA